jgi:hypothetical protein
MKVHEFKRAHSRVTLGPAYLPGDEATLVLHVSRVWFDILVRTGELICNPARGSYPSTRPRLHVGAEYRSVTRTPHGGLANTTGGVFRAESKTAFL